MSLLPQVPLSPIAMTVKNFLGMRIAHVATPPKADFDYSFKTVNRDYDAIIEGQGTAEAQALKQRIRDIGFNIEDHVDPDGDLLSCGYGFLSSSFHPSPAADAFWTFAAGQAAIDAGYRPFILQWDQLQQVEPQGYIPFNHLMDRIATFCFLDFDGGLVDPSGKPYIFLVTGFSGDPLFSYDVLNALGARGDQILRNAHNDFLGRLVQKNSHLRKEPVAPTRPNLSDLEKIEKAASLLYLHPWQDVRPLPPTILIASSAFHFAIDRLDADHGHSPRDYSYRAGLMRYQVPALGLWDGKYLDENGLMEWLLETELGSNFRFGSEENQNRWTDFYKNFAV